MLGRLQMQGEPTVRAGTLSDLRTAIHKMHVQSTPTLSSAACRAASLFCSYRCASTLVLHSFAARLLAVPFCQPCFVQVANKNSKQDWQRGCCHRWSIRLWQWDRWRLSWLPERGDTEGLTPVALQMASPALHNSLVILCQWLPQQQTCQGYFWAGSGITEPPDLNGPCMLYASWPEALGAFGQPGLNLGLLRASWQENCALGSPGKRKGKVLCLCCCAAYCSSRGLANPKQPCPSLQHTEVVGAEALQPETDRRLENIVQLFLEPKGNKSVINGWHSLRWAPRKE